MSCSRWGRLGHRQFEGEGGAAAGAVAFAITNVRGAMLAVVIVVALALWALWRERTS